MKLAIKSGHLIGKDPGAVGNGLEEARIVEAVQNECSRVLRANYVCEILDTDLIYTDDVPEINSWKADYAIEFHMNSASATATGFETWVYPDNTSTKFQDKIHSKFFESTKSLGITGVDRGKRQSNEFYFLRGIKCPSMIVEIGFISNKAEAIETSNDAVKLGELYAHDIASALGLSKKGNVVVPPKPTQPTQPTPSQDEVIVDRYAEKGQFIPNVAEGGIYVRTEPKFTSKSSAMYYNGEICPAQGQYYHEVVITNKYVYIVYKRSNGSYGYLPVRERGGNLWGKIV